MLLANGTKSPRISGGEQSRTSGAEGTALHKRWFRSAEEWEATETVARIILDGSGDGSPPA
jgi:hypothetical protein